MFYRFFLILFIIALMIIATMPDCILVCNPANAKPVAAKTTEQLQAHPWPPRTLGSKSTKKGK